MKCFSFFPGVNAANWHNNFVDQSMNMPPAFTGKDSIHAIIETPRNSRNKFTYDKQTGLFMLKKSLAAGLSFPLDFGFIPNTKAEDGDPTDVLIFMEEPGFPGCVVECKVVGVMEAQQKKDGKLIRNDRVLGVACESRLFAGITKPAHVGDHFIKELINFFELYHEKEGSEYKVLDVAGPDKALKLIKETLHYEGN